MNNVNAYFAKIKTNCTSLLRFNGNDAWMVFILSVALKIGQEMFSAWGLSTWSSVVLRFLSAVGKNKFRSSA